jgi:chromosome partitioning protein
MQQRLLIVNMKGGVGKTTLTVNLAYSLARFHKKKVLLIDIDPQFNATQYLVEQRDILSHFRTKKTIYDILVPKKEEDIDLSGKSKKIETITPPLNDYIINIKSYENNSSYFDLLPSSLKLITFESTKRGIENYLKNFINDKCSKYDFILFDCPPTLSILTLSAYLASTHNIIPVKPDFLSSLGLPLLERGLKEYEETYGHKLEPLGIVFTMVNNNASLSDEIINNIKASGSRNIFSTKLTFSTKVARTVENNIFSIDKFYKYSNSFTLANQYKKVTSEILNKINGNGNQ